MIGGLALEPFIAMDCRMPRSTSLLLRALFLLGFIIVLPLLALPPVVHYLDEALYGKAKSTIPPLVAQTELPPVAESPPGESNSPASYDSSQAGNGAHGNGSSAYEGLDALTAAPPLAPPAAFPLGAAGASSPPRSELGAPSEPALGDPQEWIAKVQQIRQRLEVLGAKYILLETADGPGKYRFHCQMLLDETSPYTRDFEAISTDPLIAAQDVLHEVEQWRLAARPSGNGTRLQ
jgi:hypothetical protein